MGSLLPEPWQPEAKTWAELLEVGIDEVWLADSLERFCASAREGQLQSFAWSAKFFKEARREWIASGMETGRNPAKHPLKDDWEIGDAGLRALANAGIPAWWGVEKLPEFRLYWNARGDRRDNWNLTFFQRCKFLWDRLTPDQHLAIANGSLSVGSTDGAGRRNTGNKRSRDISISEMLTDTSW